MKMQPIHLVASLLLTVTSVQAETTTSTPAAVTPTNLPDLIASLPHCALGCLSDAATAINCAPTNFTCLCAESKALISNLGPCILTGGSGCKPDEISDMKKIAPKFCGFVSADTNATDVRAASSLVSSALATITGTPTASGNGAARTGAAFGAVGLVGAFAVFGL